MGWKLVGLISGILFLIDLAGCRSARVVEAEKVSVDSVVAWQRHHELHKTDVKDRVTYSVKEIIRITLNEKNETLRTDREISRTRERKTERNSTTETLEGDSVRKVRTKKEEKNVYTSEKKGFFGSWKWRMLFGLTIAAGLVLTFKRIKRNITK